MAKPKTEGEPRIEYVRLSDVKPAKRNPKLHQIQAIVASIQRFGFVSPPIENAATGRIVAGHGRKEAAEWMRTQGMPVPARVKVAKDGEWLIPVLRGVSFESEEKAEEYLLGDNRISELGGWDHAALGTILKEIQGYDTSALLATGWTAEGIAEILDLPGGGASDQAPTGPAPSLADRFLVPPFSVLDARQGYWQDRKRAWIAIGIKSELGRTEDGAFPLEGTALLAVAKKLPRGGGQPKSRQVTSRGQR